MCDESSCHHKTFLRQLYWYLAIKLLCCIAGEPYVLTGIALCLCLCPSFSVSLCLCTGHKMPIYYYSVSPSLYLCLSVCLSLCLSVCLSLSLPLSLSLSSSLSHMCMCKLTLCVTVRGLSVCGFGCVYVFMHDWLWQRWGQTVDLGILSRWHRKCMHCNCEL